MYRCAFSFAIFAYTIDFGFSELSAKYKLSTLFDTPRVVVNFGLKYLTILSHYQGYFPLTIQHTIQKK